MFGHGNKVAISRRARVRLPLRKAVPIFRHRRACPGDLDQEGKAVPLESGWPGQARP